MKVCLDTCAYSSLMRGNAPLRNFLEYSDLVAIPVIVLGELHAGFEIGRKREENERRLLEFMQIPGVTVQDVTWDMARRYALLVAALRAAGTPLPSNDIWIAATAMELGAHLVSYDTHFSAIPGLIVESPA
jgi:predicted nucleic acid-binding protein